MAEPDHGAAFRQGKVASQKEDAQETVRLVEEAGRTAVQVSGDIRDQKVCRRIMERAVDELGDARSTRPDSLSGSAVKVGDADTRALQEEWERREIPVPLTVVGSPYREFTRPIIDVVKSLGIDSPRRSDRVPPGVRGGR